MTPIFSKRARWIWRADESFAYNEYVRFRKAFALGRREGEAATLAITADALYQAWVNGRMVGHGPAKSAEGRRSVDRYDIGPFLRPGTNHLEVLVLSLGVGSMTYCPGSAGVIFQIDLPRRKIVSDGATLVRRERGRRRTTVRRWILPCLEDVDGAAAPGPWTRARVTPKQVALYRRRVPLPSRQALVPRRIVAAEVVRVPGFSISLRLKPPLARGTERRRCNMVNVPARVTVELFSPIRQTMEFVPSLGNVTWKRGGKVIFKGSGWTGWDRSKHRGVIRLERGTTRLEGLHERSHFEDVSLCAFVRAPVRVRHARVDPLSLPPSGGRDDSVAPTLARDLSERRLAAKPSRVRVWTEANAFDRVANARHLRGATLEGALPPTRKGEAVRVVYDLGVLHNGWLAFDAVGERGSRLVFAFAEAVDEGPPLRIQWPAGCNNALTYRLRGGWQSFESFLPYGVRYIIVQHEGPRPARVENLRVLLANCGGRPQGDLRCSDLLLNGIREICAQAAISATDDTFTDCPTFEQVNWNFDNRMAALTDSLTCASTDVARNSIQLFAEDPGYPGLVRSQYPSAWDNRIPLWSFHWIMMVRDYYWQTGDKAFVRKMFPRVAAGIKEALGKVGSTGLLEWPVDADTWHFVEWGHGRDDAHAILSAEQAGLVGALADAEELARAVGRPEPRWPRARRALCGAIHRHLWDAERDAYRDSMREDGSRSAIMSQASNAALALYGVGSRAWARRLARRIVKGDERLLPYGSPAGAYYVLELLDRLGEVEEIFRIIRRRWGEMVLNGDTTTWEHFGEFGHAGWPTRSRCHPYASYVSKYLVKYLLGVEALAPGFARVRVRPRPPDGVERCQGAIPTPRGLLRVAWERRRGRIRVESCRLDREDRRARSPR